MGVIRRLLRRGDVQRVLGIGRSGLYKRMHLRLWPVPIKLVGQSVLTWPSDEVKALIDAAVAGMSESETKKLVEKIEREREIPSRRSTTVPADQTDDVIFGGDSDGR